MCCSEVLFHRLAEYCDEFLVHAVDVEGKRCGIQVGYPSLCCGYSWLILWPLCLYSCSKSLLSC
jgi:hypothetical protein